METSSEYNLSAPAVERALRNSSSNRSDQRSSSTARSSPESTASFSHPRPTSQPNFSTQLPDLDPWDTVERVATAPPPPGPTPGWTVFPESSPSPAPRAAWAPQAHKQPPALNNNAYNSHNGYKRFCFCFILFFLPLTEYFTLSSHWARKIFKRPCK